MKKTAVLYARFSPRKNAADCESCDTQIDYLRRHCDLLGFSVSGVHRDEGLSGKSAANRPGLKAALDQVCAEKGILLVYSLSRLARSTMDAIEIAGRLEKHGADLKSLHEQIDTTTAMGRFTFRLLAALAELEREQIAERTSEAMLRHQETGRRMTRSDRVRYGWQEVNGELVPNPAERATLNLMIRKHSLGWEPGKIARWLNEQGYEPRSGGRWLGHWVKRLLDREQVKLLAGGTDHEPTEVQPDHDR